jgi:hypothetical protein
MVTIDLANFFLASQSDNLAQFAMAHLRIDMSPVYDFNE